MALKLYSTPEIHVHFRCLIPGDELILANLSQETYAGDDFPRWFVDLWEDGWAFVNFYSDLSVNRRIHIELRRK